MDRKEIITLAAKASEEHKRMNPNEAQIFANAGEMVSLYLKHRYGVNLAILPDDILEFIACVNRSKALMYPAHHQEYSELISITALKAEMCTGPVHNATVPVKKQPVETVQIEAELEQFVKQSLAPQPPTK